MLCGSSGASSFALRTGSSQQSQTTSCFVLALLAQPLGADSQGSAWNFCAPAVDYDSMRKEAATIFTEKRAEVQQLVAKLHKTQRAAEKALDA